MRNGSWGDNKLKTDPNLHNPNIYRSELNVKKKQKF